MNLKKKLAFSIGTALLAVGLIGSGTFAYFVDAVETSGTFTSGTLDLSLDQSVIVNVDNIKPGDTFTRQFKIKNDGSLNISEVLLHTSYEVIDAEGDNSEDFGKHILVHFLENTDKIGSGLDRERNLIIESTTLYDLQNMKPDVVKALPTGSREDSGLKVGDSDRLLVVLEFVDNGEDQNEFQGDSLILNWSFEAKQEAGEER